MPEDHATENLQQKDDPLNYVLHHIMPDGDTKIPRFIRKKTQ